MRTQHIYIFLRIERLFIIFLFFAMFFLWLSLSVNFDWFLKTSFNYFSTDILVLPIVHIQPYTEQYLVN